MKSQDVRQLHQQDGDYTADDLPNIPIYIVVHRTFITTCCLLFSECIQHDLKDEGGIRPDGYEPPPVFAGSFFPCLPVSGRLSVILVFLPLREPPFHVDLPPLP